MFAFNGETLFVFDGFADIRNLVGSYTSYKKQKHLKKLLGNVIECAVMAAIRNDTGNVISLVVRFF